MKINLICLPYAGGWKHSYEAWRKYMPQEISMYTVELKGRGSRIGQGFYDSFMEVVVDTLDQIISIIEKEDYVLFGHSMGGGILINLMDVIDRRKLRKPLYLYISSFAPPHIKNDVILHELPYHDFIKKISELGGIPDEILADERALKLCSTILLKDITLLEQHQWDEHLCLGDIPLIALCGSDDVTDYNIMKEWKRYTQGHFEVKEFHGNHFYLLHDADRVCSYILERIINIQI